MVTGYNPGQHAVYDFGDAPRSAARFGIPPRAATGAKIPFGARSRRPVKPRAS